MTTESVALCRVQSNNVLRISDRRQFEELSNRVRELRGAQSRVGRAW